MGHGLAGLLGDFGGNAVEAAGVRCDGVEIGGSADEVESAEGFPNFVVAGKEIGDGLVDGNGGAVVREPAIERAGDFGTQIFFAGGRDDFGEQVARVNGFAGFDARAKSAGVRRIDGRGAKHVDDYIVARGVVETNESQGGVAADVDAGVGEHGRERGVEFGGLVVLAHGPRSHGADFGMRIRGERDDVRVERFHGGVAGDDAIGDLRERVLDVVRVRGRLEIFGELGVRERASEPGGAPKKKWHEDEEEREDEHAVGPTADAGAGGVWRSCGV